MFLDTITFFINFGGSRIGLLKSASIDSNRLWKAAGKPRHGPIFDKLQTCRAQHRRKIRESQQMNDLYYSNGCVDSNVIIAKFHEHFAKLYDTTNLTRATDLRNEYSNQRANYVGFPTESTSLVDTELVNNITDNLSHGKTADLGGLVAEHLQNCHPIKCHVSYRNCST